ncbi:Major Facilitator Superfamily [Aspergillus sclerotialis]|uniref:Major Facilitator Superfamily n=1 Tax=Aspergillus sclerotialis TaxID=2070753 RepID=A0A3A2ZFR3_9EURO|nr:Major Facilitator Superfamily [Aspergillus sclerotialis]
MSILRTFALRMAESPKWLISQGRGDEAVASINTISRVNKSTYTISSSELHEEQAESRKNVKTVLRMIADLLRAYYLEAHGVKLGNEACIKRIATGQFLP